jgi:hypothetical protein
MFDVAQSLLPALDASRDALSRAAERTATAYSQTGTSGANRAMADAARQAIFTEAILGAVHARLAEIKDAAR